MAEELVDSIISNEAFVQVKKLQDELRDTIKVLIDVTNNAKAFDTVLRGAKGLHELQQAIREGANAQELLVAAGKKVIDTTAKIKTAQKVATDSLVAYNEQVKKLTNEYNALGSSEEKDLQRKAAIRKEVLSLTAAFSGQKKAIQDAKKGIDAAETSYYELQNETAKLGKQLKSMPGAFDATTGAINKNNKEAVLMADQIKTNNDLLKKYDASLGQHFRNVGNYKSAAAGLKNYLTFVTGYFGAAFVAASATKAIINSNIEISDSLTEVQRVAGLTTGETNKLYDSLKQINTRTSLKGLLDLARVGAQLGIAKKDLAGFSEALNELSVTLGSELQGGPEAIASSLGKINNLLDINQQFGVSEGLKKTGSAILALGQKTIATGGYLADFAERVGGVAKIAHISLPTVLAYGAVLEANGVTAELAGTNFQRLIVQLGRVPDKFYTIAKAADPNLTLKQFTEYINKDATKALQLFFEGLGKSTDKFTDFAKLTQSIGLPGQRTAQILSAIATSASEVATNVDTANQAFNEGTEIGKQYNLVNDNLAGSFEQLKNELVKITTDPQSDIGSFFKKIIQSVTNLIKELGNLGDSFTDILSVLDKSKHPIENFFTMQLSGVQGFFTGLFSNGGISFSNAKKTAQEYVDQYTQLTDMMTHPDKYVDHKGDTGPVTIDEEKLSKNRKLLTKEISDQYTKLKGLVNLQKEQQRSANSFIFGTNKNNISPVTGINQITDEDIQRERTRLSLLVSLANKLKETKDTDFNLDKKPKPVSDLQAEASQQIALDKKLRDERVKNAQKEAQAQRDIETEKLQNSIDLNKEIMNDDNRSFSERLAAFKNYIQDEIKLINQQRDSQIQALKDTALAQALKNKQDQALLDARKKKKGKLTDAEADSVIAMVSLTPDEQEAVIATLANQIAEINLKAANKSADIVRNAPKQGLSIAGAGLNNDTANSNDLISEQGDYALIALNSQYEQRLITQKQYEKQREDLEYQTNAAILQNQIEAAQKYVEAAEKAGYDVADSKRKLADLEMQLSDLSTQHVINNEQRKRDKVVTVLQEIQQFGDQFIGILSDAADNNATAQKNAIQEQIDSINEAKQTEIDAVNASLLSQQDKADKISIINARAQAQTEALARRQQKIDQEKARYDKAKAIFDIILGTAVAVTQALPNIPLSIIIGALGAAELAVASAAPIPQYAKGREGGPAEWAVVGEKGPELIQYPDGKQALTPDKPTITFLPENAIVKPHNETIIELAKQAGVNAMRNIPVINDRDVSREYMVMMQKEMRDLKRVFEARPVHETNFSWTEQGVRKWVNKGVARTKYLNRING